MPNNGYANLPGGVGPPSPGSPGEPDLGGGDQLGSAFNPRTTRGIPASSCCKISNNISLRDFPSVEIVLTTWNPLLSGKEGLSGFALSEDMARRGYIT